MWRDKNVEANTDGKSIFDPSPIGWRIPVRYAYSDFNSTNSSYLVDNVATYKSGTVNANYYATGRRSNGTSALAYAASRAFYYTSTPVFCFSITSYSINIGSEWSTNAMAVRAIRE